VKSAQAGKFVDLNATPVYNARVNRADSNLAHLDDFFLNVKSRGRCHCPVEEAYKAMVAVSMAIKAYETQKTVRWDAQREQMIV
jgi:hypothetical protein